MRTERGTKVKDIKIILNFELRNKVGGMDKPCAELVSVSFVRGWLILNSVRLSDSIELTPKS